MGPTEIGRALGLSRQRVEQIMRLPEFPDPEASLARGRVWSSDKVRTWAETTGRTFRDPETD